MFGLIRKNKRLNIVKTLIYYPYAYCGSGPLRFMRTYGI